MEISRLSRPVLTLKLSKWTEIEMDQFVSKILQIRNGEFFVKYINRSLCCNSLYRRAFLFFYFNGNFTLQSSVVLVLTLFTKMVEMVQFAIYFKNRTDTKQCIFRDLNNFSRSK